MRERAEADPVYETEDWRLFMDRDTLPQKAGCQPRHIRQVVLKELVDNALDAGANVTLEQIDGLWVAADDGPGIDPAMVPVLFAVNRPLRSSKLRRMPLRGMLGNGLRVVAGAVAAFDGSLVVETRGHCLTLSVCRRTGKTIVESDEEISTAVGTTVRLGMGWCPETVGSLARSSISLAQGQKPYAGRSCPWWYRAKDMARLFSSVTPEDTTVGAICRSLGLDEYEDDRPARTLSPADAAAVLANLRAKYTPVAPDALGCLGKDADLVIGEGTTVEYAKQVGVHGHQTGAAIPYVIEAWAQCERSETRGDGSVDIQVALNRSITTAVIAADCSGGAIRIAGCSLAHQSFDIPNGHYSIVLSIITPHVQLAGDGKEPVLAPFATVIGGVLRKACSAAHRRMERPERKLSIKDAAWMVMPEAYRIASDGGRLPANARQIMYAARPLILKLTGKTTLDDTYFTQTLLPDYVTEHGKETEWDVVFDARGSLVEPHTYREVRLGTIDVRSYLGGRPELSGPVVIVSALIVLNPEAQNGPIHACECWV